MAALVMSLSGAMDFIFGNIMWFVIAGMAVYFISNYFRLGKKLKFKIIDRNEIERIKFVERMKMNPSKDYSLFVVGNRVVGKISHFRQYTVGNPSKQFTQMLMKPLLISKGNINIANPMAKVRCVEVDSKIVALNSVQKLVIVPAKTTFDFMWGMHYDIGDEKDHLANLKQDNVMRTDLDQMGSRYWVKSQEQCVFAPEMALQMALKSQELAIELAKRKGKADTI